MLKKLDQFLHKHLLLLILITFLTILRIPNFFEPYWYGDEAIYLTVGTGLREGQKMYSEIIDHKTPLIYYLAMTPTQFDFRVLNYVWTVGIVIFFYRFAKHLLKKEYLAFISTLILIIFTTLPWFEGNIPNGELFVMGFVLAGAYILSKTKFFADFLGEKSKENKNEKLMLVSSGIFMGLGIMTKVPALLDLTAFLSIGWFSVFNRFSLKDAKFLKQFLPSTVFKTILIFVGALIPIILSIVYYVSLGSGKDYLDFGLMYNFRYSGSWQLDLGSELLEKMFTLPMKTLLLAAVLLFVTFAKKLFKPAMQFSIAWFAMTFYAALLSNRPYPHYFIQVMPAIALMSAITIGSIVDLFTKKSKSKSKKAQPIHAVFNTLATGAMIYLFISVLVLMNVGLYPTAKYYKNFSKLATNQISKQEYDESFNHLVKENYEIAKIINERGVKEIFIWGTNPMLYAQTQTVPTSRFTVSFHIKDFDAYDETFEIIKEKEPKIVVVMKNETQEFDKLYAYLQRYYLPNRDFEHMVVYLKDGVH